VDPERVKAQKKQMEGKFVPSLSKFSFEMKEQIDKKLPQKELEDKVNQEASLFALDGLTR